MGLFAGSGVGKSTLLGQIARQTEADVNVIALVGERGREVASSSRTRWARPDARARSSCARPATPPPRAPEGGLRGDRHRRVVPRARPARAVHAGLGDARRARAARGRPGRRRAAGAPGLSAQRVRAAAAAARAHRQRAARARSPRSTPCWSPAATWTSRSPTRCAASSTATSCCRATLAARNHWPAIDVLPSLSRLMTPVADAGHRAAAARVRELLAAYERHRDLIALGAYQRGSDPRPPTGDRHDGRHQGLPAPAHRRDRVIRRYEDTPAGSRRRSSMR